MPPDLPKQIADKRPELYRFAMSLTRNEDKAEDLVQETILKALNNLKQFEAGTNLEAWLFTIMKNARIRSHRKTKREQEDPDETLAKAVAVPAMQSFNMELTEALKTINSLPTQMLEAFKLVVMEDYSYEMAADILEVSVGAIKSRVNRAQEKLVQIGLGMKNNGHSVGDVRRLWEAGASASEIAAKTNEDIVVVMQAIATFGKRK